MTQARIAVTRDTIDIDELRLTDAALAAFVSETPEADRPALAERALRIGLLTLANAGVSLSADVVKAEFERLTDRMEATQKRAAEALANTLRENFADGDGRLPRTLERFLGDDGQLRRITRDLFDENQRESALGKLNEILGKYFDGDGSRLAHLLDPTRAGSPLHQFRGEVTDEFRRLSERITALEEAKRARAEERARGTAKGADFEDALEERLGAMARGLGDLLEPTGTEGGDAMRSKKGDLVITIDPTRTRGKSAAHRGRGEGPLDAHRPHDHRAGRGTSQPLGRDRAGRLHPAFGTYLGDAAGARRADVYATYDPLTDDAVALEAAYRTARILALLTLRDAPMQLDAEAITRSLEDLTRQVDCVRGLKTKLTAIGSTAREVSTHSTCFAAASSAASRSSRRSSPSWSRTPRPA